MLKMTVLNDDDDADDDDAEDDDDDDDADDDDGDDDDDALTLHLLGLLARCWASALKSGQQALYSGKAPGRRPLALAIGLPAPAAALQFAVFFAVFCSSTKADFSSQDGPTWPKMSPKMAQHRPNIGPRWPQDRPT